MQAQKTEHSTPEMVDSVNVFILANRIITKEYISKQLGISESTAYKIVHDGWAFSKG